MHKQLTYTTYLSYKILLIMNINGLGNFQYLISHYLNSNAEA